jgi:hypothetical protein
MLRYTVLNFILDFVHRLNLYHHNATEVVFYIRHQAKRKKREEKLYDVGPLVELVSSNFVQVRD